MVRGFTNVSLSSFLISALIASSIAVTGCTTFTATRVELPDGPTPEGFKMPEGVFYPDHVPLLVIANGQASILMVKSADRGTVIQFSAFLAKHDVELDADASGNITKITSNQDATALPVKLVDLAKAVADKLPAGLGLSGTSAPATAIQIYRIRFKDGEIDRLEPLLNPDNEHYLFLAPSPATGSGGTPIEDINAIGGSDKTGKPAPNDKPPTKDTKPAPH